VMHITDDQCSREHDRGGVPEATGMESHQKYRKFVKKPKLILSPDVS